MKRSLWFTVFVVCALTLLTLGCNNGQKAESSKEQAPAPGKQAPRNNAAAQ
jgi:hypothetical protein